MIDSQRVTVNFVRGVFLDGKMDYQNQPCSGLSRASEGLLLSCSELKVLVDCATR